MNPLDDYLLTKEAVGGPTGPIIGGDMLSKSKGLKAELAGGFRKGLSNAAGMAGPLAAGGVVAGAGVVGMKIYRAARKREDFKSMMSNNPDLQEYHDQNPGQFTRHYDSLRTLAPGFAEDPIISGGLMRQMSNSPQHAGSALMLALKDHQSTAPKANASLGPASLSF